MSNKPLLVIKSEHQLPRAQRDQLTQAVEALGSDLGMKAIVLDGGLDAEMHHDLSPLVDAITAQTEAISRLAESNMMLVAALADVDGDEGMPPMRYMDGTPIRG